MAEVDENKADIVDYWKKFQTFLGLLYLLMIATGMLFNYQKYSQFGVNIFQYADVFDFFIAPFEDGVILIFATATLLFCWLLTLLDSLLRNKSEKIYTFFHFGMNKKPWFNRYLFIMFALVIIVYMYLSASIYGKQAEKNILKTDPITLVFSDDQKMVAKQIGKTKEIIFLLDGDSVIAVPITSLVKKIQIK